MNNLRIAVQSRGRLSDASLDFLARLGLSFCLSERTYITTCANAPIDLIFLRDDDIPEYVEQGVADFGIVGENVLLEKKPAVKVVKKLGFAECSLVIAVPVNASISSVSDLSGERIATSYPRLLKEYLFGQGVDSAIISLKGSVEIAPALNLADAICDLTQSGKTLQENNLRVLVTVLESQAVLIQSPFVRYDRQQSILSLFSETSIL